MFLALLPEITLVVLAFVVLTTDLAIKRHHRGALPYLTAAGLLLALGFTLLFGVPGAKPQLIFGGMLRHDWLAFVFRLVFLFGALATVLFSAGWERVARRGEYYVLIITSTLGMMLMGASADLIMLFLAIETTSIPLYILAGFMTEDDKSIESGFKYLLFGAMTTAIMLYGFSMMYGISGSTNLYWIAGAFLEGELPIISLMGTLVLVMAGFAFKISMVPFHFWAPDVYEGSPTPIAGFLSTASKAAGFAVVIRVLLTAFPQEAFAGFDWTVLIAIAAAVTMSLGNLIALAQSNIKRLLAYSSVAHAGYILMGIAAASTLGGLSVVFYIIVYLVTNLAAFGVVAVAERTLGSNELQAYDGLSRRSPGLALVLLISLLSLAGVPPMGGFIAKILVFAAAVEAGMVWLAVVGILNAIVGLYYYLIVLKHVYLFRSEEEALPVPIPRPSAVALAVCLVAILVFGTFIAPWFDFSALAASALF